MSDDYSPVSLRQLAALLDVDRATVRLAIERAAVKPAGKRGGHDVFPLAESLRAIVGRRGQNIDPELMSPFDRRAHFDAELRRLDLQKKRGEVCLRADVQQASARAFATCANSIRAIPDRLERIGLSPDMAEETERQIDAALDDLADQLEETHRADERLAASVA